MPPKNWLFRLFSYSEFETREFGFIFLFCAAGLHKQMGGASLQSGADL